MMFDDVIKRLNAIMDESGDVSADFLKNEIRRKGREIATEDPQEAYVFQVLVMSLLLGFLDGMLEHAERYVTLKSDHGDALIYVSASKTGQHDMVEYERILTHCVAAGWKPENGCISNFVRGVIATANKREW